MKPNVIAKMPPVKIQEIEFAVKRSSVCEN